MLLEEVAILCTIFISFELYETIRNSLGDGGFTIFCGLMSYDLTVVPIDISINDGQGND